MRLFVVCRRAGWLGRKNICRVPRWFTSGRRVQSDAGRSLGVVWAKFERSSGAGSANGGCNRHGSRATPTSLDGNGASGMELGSPSAAGCGPGAISSVAGGEGGQGRGRRRCRRHHPARLARPFAPVSASGRERKGRKGPACLRRNKRRRALVGAVVSSGRQS
ncbi:hypothetical protein BS50DRAFT_84780 [Corynespora cassiicola Philippines]|uniref:Uncharacterized protein n=1 Tax=Corynespora cassiicola Philippines TaxID=1448308 RepID=A0A2T2NDT4_CORCC|nr:hypothetical protein BS50DRAFT_84780 [Corynespora cassiicola Philippines]